MAVVSDDGRAVPRAAAARRARAGAIGPPRAPARGLQCGAEVLSTLRRCEERLAVALRRELSTMVEAWCDACLASRKLESCCTLYAHLAFCYKHIEESELDYTSVSTLLCAHVFLGNNHVRAAHPTPRPIPHRQKQFGGQHRQGRDQLT